MAIIHDAQLHPSKSELLIEWLPSQPWFQGDAATLVQLGAYRFDDPAGEVGIETHLVAVDGRTYQVPLTYRGAPLAGAQDFLIATMEHSVLGRRWVYDATADPVYLGELAAAILTDKPQAVETLAAAGGGVLPATVQLASTGTPATSDAGLPDLRCGFPATTGVITNVPCGAVNFAILRELDTTGTVQHEHSLSARWDGQEVPVLLAAAIAA